MPERPGRFAWNGQKFRDLKTGRFVTDVQVRRTLDVALDTAKKRAQSLARDLQAGRIDQRAFHVAMRATIKDVNVYGAMLAHGGKAQMTPAAYGRVGAAIKKEYAFFDALMGELDAGLAPRDGRFLNRVGQYVDAARDTFWQVVGAEQVKRGMTLERNVLDARADHCQGSDGCVAQSKRGWVPIGTLVRIGRRACLRGCRCVLRFKKAA